MIIHAKVPAFPLSVIMPTLDEEYVLPEALASLERQNFDLSLEVILSDGGSGDGTVATFERLTRSWPARSLAARVVVCPRPGRAAQMNAGARVARGDILLFLHADTSLLADAARAVMGALIDQEVVGGGFRHRFRESGILLRAISGYVTARSVVRRIHYGDQAMFVRRSVFDDLGGFPDIPLFEDLRLSRALRARGRVVTLSLPAITSARRLRQGGVVRTAARFAWLKLRDALGADPARLKADYPDVR